jgi:transcriptional regulator with XRE-family HTH domain
MVNRRLHYLNTNEVQRLQREFGLTDERLANRAGISVVTLNKWMNGGGAFVSKIKKLADALGVQTDTIRRHDAEAKVVSADGTRHTSIEIQIRVSIPYGYFEREEQLESYVSSLQSLASMQCNIIPLGIEEGSTIITLMMEPSDVMLLLRAFVVGKLKPLKITAVKVYVFFFIKGIKAKPIIFPIQKDAKWIEEGDGTFLSLQRDFEDTASEGAKQPT